MCQAVDPTILGVAITKIRRTQEGHLLFEMKGGLFMKSGRPHPHRSGSRHHGPISKLGATADVEVVDLNQLAEEKDVLVALQSAIGRDDDTEAATDKDWVTVIGMWSTKSGQKIATTKIPASSAKKIERVVVGFTITKVRPKREEPSGVLGATVSGTLCRRASVRICSERVGSVVRSAMRKGCTLNRRSVWHTRGPVSSSRTTKRDRVGVR